MPLEVVKYSPLPSANVIFETELTAPVSSNTGTEIGLTGFWRNFHATTNKRFIFPLRDVVQGTCDASSFSSASYNRSRPFSKTRHFHIATTNVSFRSPLFICVNGLVVSPLLSACF